MKLFIVDGSNLLFQMFFGMPSRIINEEGRAIQGTLGFIGALLKMIRKVEPTHLLVVFDGEHENERVEIDAEYKSNRPDYSQVPEEDNPYSQLQDIYNALNYMKIKYIETIDCEADDLISGYVHRYKQAGDIVISSFDSDFFQLIDERVSILRYRGENTVLCTSDYLLDKYGVTASQYADFKSLTGDHADNIKGADKVGPKTAAELLRQFGDLEHILQNVDQIKKASVRSSVSQSVDRLKKNYQLIKLGESGELPFELNELLYQYDGSTTNQVLVGIGVKSA